MIALRASCSPPSIFLTSPASTSRCSSSSPLGELGFDGFALLQPVGEHLEVVGATAQRGDEGDVLLEPPPALHHPLRLGLVLPEVGLADARFDAGQFFRGTCGVKDNSASRPTAS